MANEKDHCGICKGTEEDSEGGEHWIECSKCLQWYHNMCIDLIVIPDDLEQWLCPLCMRKVDDKGNSNQQNEVLNGDTTGSTQTTVPGVASEREQMQLISELIKEKEALVALKQKQLDMMERISQRDNSDKTNQWLQKTPSTSKGDMVSSGVEAQASLSGRRGRLSQQSEAKKSSLKLSNHSGSGVDDKKHGVQ